MVGEQYFGSAEDLDEHGATAQAQGGFEGVGQTGLEIGTDHDAIDDDLDLRRAVRFDGGVRFQVVDFAVDPRTHKAGPQSVGKDPGVAVGPGGDRRQDQQAGALGPVKDDVGHLLDGMAAQRATALRAVRLTGTGV